MYECVNEESYVHRYLFIDRSPMYDIPIVWYIGTTSHVVNT